MSDCIEYCLRRLPDNAVLQFQVGSEEGTMAGKCFVKYGLDKYVRNKLGKGKMKTDWVGFVWRDTFEEAIKRVIDILAEETA